MDLAEGDAENTRNSVPASDVAEQERFKMIVPEISVIVFTNTSSDVY